VLLDDPFSGFFSLFSFFFISFFLPSFLSFFLSFFLSVFLSFSLSFFLSFFLSSFLSSFFLPFFLPNYSSLLALDLPTASRLAQFLRTELTGAYSEEQPCGGDEDSSNGCAVGRTLIIATHSLHLFQAEIASLATTTTTTTTTTTATTTAAATAAKEYAMAGHFSTDNAMARRSFSTDLFWLDGGAVSHNQPDTAAVACAAAVEVAAAAGADPPKTTPSTAGGQSSALATGSEERGEEGEGKDAAATRTVSVAGAVGGVDDRVHEQGGASTSLRSKNSSACYDQADEGSHKNKDTDNEDEGGNDFGGGVGDDDDDDDAEERRDGSLSSSTVWLWVDCVGWHWALAIFISTAAMQASSNLAIWWLGHWVAEDTDSADGISTSYFLAAAGILLAANILCACARSLSFAQGNLRGARRLYDRLQTALLRAELSFFETPQGSYGRVLNRLGVRVLSVCVSVMCILQCFSALAL
jgi:hypothetical protein